jgi:hypothetical protein
VCNKQNSLKTEEAEALEQICLEEDISRILEWKEDAGITINLKIALIMAR